MLEKWKFLEFVELLFFLIFFLCIIYKMFLLWFFFFCILFINFLLVLYGNIQIIASFGK